MIDNTQRRVAPGRMTMTLRHRPWALLVALLAAMSLFAAACGDDDGGGDDGGGESSADMSELRLGGPPDCPTNAFCLPGLETVYGIDLSENFVELDGGGPLTIEALQGGEIDIAVLFSTDGQIAENDWIVLADPEGLINADNIVPVMSDELIDAYGEDFESVVDDVSGALNTEGLTELNRLFTVELMDADEVASIFLENEGLLDEGDAPPDGPTITIGAQDFGESYVLSQLYGQALEAKGYPVEYQDLGGFRDIVFASFENGDINFTAEYAASALEFLNEGAGEATGDAEETTELLRGYLEPLGLVAAAYSEAVDSNAFVVTQEVSDEYGLTSLADLAG
jgi:glycine betaine/choline ABC-type transport system substrate-binding protein